MITHARPCHKFLGTQDIIVVSLHIKWYVEGGSGEMTGRPGGVQVKIKGNQYFLLYHAGICEI